MNSYSQLLSHEQIERLRAHLSEHGYDFSEKPHAIFSAHKGKLNITAYHKGPKILIQGKDTEDFIRFTLEPYITGVAALDYQEVLNPEQFEPHFGIDESGKGDYFGPLVIAGVYTNATSTRALTQAGIMDSKRISSPARIRQLAQTIRATQGIHWEMVSLGPQRYNEILPSFRNLNQLLAWGHARVIEKLAAAVPHCTRALSDQFAKPEILQKALSSKHLNITLDQRTKAESDIAVAAASILARERFIDWMDQTSRNSGITLPLGASNAVITAAKELIQKHGPEALAKTAKLHFKTTQSVLPHSPSTPDTPPSIDI